MGVDGDTITQVVTVVAAVLAIIGHQQRSIDKLRKEFRKDNRRLRKEYRRLRNDHAELKQSFDQLRATVADIAQPLARIEGFLGIGMSANAAARARRRLRRGGARLSGPGS